jgi:hypothetical protein
VVEGELAEVVDALLQAEYDEKINELMNKTAF